MQTGKLLGLFTLAVSMAVPSFGQAAESALMMAPARNAAVINTVPGFKSANLDLYLGKRLITEGVVIRKSKIKDGKIIIPPAGMYYSSRIASVGTMTRIEVMLLGKQYSEVDEAAEYLVLKDHTMKLGDSINLLPDGSRALQFVNGSSHPYGNAAGYSNLRIMKSSGNFYGTNFQVAADPTLIDVNSGKFDGLGLAEGRHPFDAMTGDPVQKAFFGASIYPSGRSYLIVDKTSAKEVHVKEFATPSLTKLWLSASPRISGAYAAGEEIALGDCKVKILSVSADAAKISLTDAKGKVTEKSFTGLSDRHSSDYLPSSPAARAKYQMANAADTVRVQVAMLNPEGVVTKDNKIQLDMYSDVFTLANPQDWPGDKRFLFRPDT